jgi:voltage-gated potassium channel
MVDRATTGASTPTGAPAGPEPAARSHPDVPSRRLLLLGVSRTMLTTTAVLVLYFTLPLTRAFTGGTLVALLLGLVAVGMLVAWQVRAIVRARTPALRAVESLALSLPLFLVLFAATYVVLADSYPQAFSEPLTRLDSLYFVLTVFATVGFGDIAPVSQVARVLTTVQMVGDLLLIGLGLKVFLAAVDHGRRRAEQPRSEAAPDGTGQPREAQSAQP